MADDPLSIAKKRAGYRANHRGTKEMDWLLGRFADHWLPSASESELAHFERFLAHDDRILQKCLMGQEGSEAEFLGNMDAFSISFIKKIKAFHQTNK